MYYQSKVPSKRISEGRQVETLINGFENIILSMYYQSKVLSKSISKTNQNN